MSDVSGATNFFPFAHEGFTTTVGAAGVGSGGSVVPLNSVIGLEDGDVFVGIVEPGETNEQTFTGVVDIDGSRVRDVIWTRGDDAAHPAGVTVVDYVCGTYINLISRGILVHAYEDGTLKPGAVDRTSVLADDIVTTAKLSTTAGQIAGVWTSYTPTYTNVTLGTGSTVTAKYWKVGKTIKVRLSITLGTGGSIGSSPTFSLPFATASGYVTDAPLGTAIYTDTGTQAYAGYIAYSSTTVALFSYYRQDSAPIKVGGISASAPFAFGNGDSLTATLEYELL